VKHRIVGLVILIALAVIFLPFLFQHNVSMNPHDQTPADAVSSQTVHNQQRIALKPNSVATPAQHYQTTPVKRVVVHHQKTAARQHHPQRVSHQPVKHAGTAKPSHPKKTQSVAKHPKLKLPSLPNGWLVQVGSFSNKVNAERMVQKLRNKGYSAYVHEEHHRHALIRQVQVGPAISRAKAEQLRKKLYKEFKLKGYLIKYNV